MELCWRSLTEVADLIRRRELSPLELVRHLLDRIERLDGRLGSFITVLGDEAMASARKAEKSLSRNGRLKALHGVPISLKDNIHVRGVRTTAGSKIWANLVAQEDATVVVRLRKAGAIILGKTNLHELACGVTTINPHYGTTRNPWDLDRIVGGSSGGSAAAVAAGLSYGALGTDTGGSVRIPAALCGVVGLKPTYGRVSRHGVVPLAWSLDHAGSITRTVEDASLMLAVISGHDSNDPTSYRGRRPKLDGATEGGISGMRIGIVPGLFDDAALEVKDLVQDGIDLLDREGASISEVEIPHLEHIREVSITIALTELSSSLQPWLANQLQAFGEDVRRLLVVGSLVPATAYLTAQRARKRLVREIEDVFKLVDVLIAPTVSAPACTVGAETVDIGDQEVDLPTAYIGLNPLANIAGLPAISVPCGFIGHLPMGLQIIGRPFEEATILRVAGVHEDKTEWTKYRPPHPFS